MSSFEIGTMRFEIQSSSNALTLKALLPCNCSSGCDGAGWKEKEIQLPDDESSREFGEFTNLAEVQLVNFS